MSNHSEAAGQNPNEETQEVNLQETQTQDISVNEINENNITDAIEALLGQTGNTGGDSTNAEEGEEETEQAGEPEGGEVKDTPEGEEEQEAEEAEGETETEEAEPVIAVVNDELISKYPTLKGLRGKPIDDLAKSYDNIVRLSNKLSNELHSLKKSMVKAEDNFSDMPDPVTEPDEFKAWMTERDKRILESVRTAPEGEESRTDVQEKLNHEIASRLKVKTQEVPEIVKEFVLEKTDELYDETGQPNALHAFYLNNPDKFIADVVTYKKLRDYENSLQSVEKSKDIDLRKKTAEGVKKGIQKANQSVVLNDPTRMTPKPKVKLSNEDKILAEIYDMARTP